MKGTIITPNTPHVVAEDFDNEVIIVNLYNGNYYSLRDSAATIWKLITQNPQYETLVESTATAYDVSPTEIIDNLDQFLEHLHKDRMVRFEQPNGHAAAVLSLPQITGTFVAPKLESYSDMQDLLLLDPIHDVEENKGWPEKK